MRNCPRCNERPVAKPRAAYCQECHADYCREKKYWEKEKNRNYNSRNSERLREYRLKRKYGLTIENYNRMYTEQNGRCKICRKHYDKLFVDHDHSTGKIRNLLCNTCNSGLGLFQEDPIILASAIQYLAESQNADL